MTAKSATPRTDKRKARPKPGTRLGGMTDSDTPRVTEPEARAAYIAMKGRRSSAGVREKFMKDGRKVPSLRTFDKWRARHEWIALAREHDEKVAARAIDEIAKEAVVQVVTRAHQFDKLADESLTKALDGLAKIDVNTLKAIDIRALADVSERATRMFELLEGRATDRTDNLTREKMDRLIQEMKDDIEEVLDGVRRSKAIH